MSAEYGKFHPALRQFFKDFRCKGISDLYNEFIPYKKRDAIKNSRLRKGRKRCSLAKFVCTVCQVTFMTKKPAIRIAASSPALSP